MNKPFYVIAAMWIIGIIVNLAIIVLIGWVAWHFISKFW